MATRRRGVASANPLIDCADYDLHVFLKKIVVSPYEAMDEVSGGSAPQMCKCLWDARRRRNVELCKLDESGNAQGWSAAARFLLVSSHVRSEFNVPFNYLSEDGSGGREVRRKWATSCMLHADYRISKYDARDVELALRTIGRMWLSKWFWKYDPASVCKLLEILLYDLNLRLEEIVCEMKPGTELPSELIRESVDTTAMTHGILIAYKKRVLKCDPVAPLDALVGMGVSSGLCGILEGSGLTHDKYTAALKKFRENIRTEYFEISKMGRLPENIAKMLRYLLLPIDIYSRYKAIEKLETDSHLCASQRVLSLAETTWLDFKMPDLKAEQLLDSSSFRPDHAHLFEMACVFKTCDLLLRQFNVAFQWIGRCVVLGRDSAGYSNSVWMKAAHHHPCIVTMGYHYYVVYRESVVATDDAYEAVFVWMTVIKQQGYEVRMSPRESFRIRREITMLYDKCFPDEGY